uniref:Tubulin polymerization promoting protein n=1 Tax=Eptatretus burgeri TaxID=7764 RepID=A0A8C4Q6P6_EPTBU
MVVVALGPSHCICYGDVTEISLVSNDTVNRMPVSRSWMLPGGFNLCQLLKDCLQKSARVITFEEFLEALRQLSRKRFKEQKTDDAFQELLHLVAGKAPIVHGITKVKNVGAVGRLTDTSKYTGMHRLRFDEAGHGRGKAGREDIPDQRGYVEGYRDAGTYDQKVKGIDSPTCSKN